MGKTTFQTSKKKMFAAFGGTVLVALCCFSPVLVVLLAAIGLSALTPYLDWVLLPALGIIIIVSMVSYLRWRKSAKKESQANALRADF